MAATDGLHGGAAELFRQGPFTAKTKKNEGEEEGKREKVNVGGGGLAEGERK